MIAKAFIPENGAKVFVIMGFLGCGAVLRVRGGYQESQWTRWSRG